jgi:hypothetical protein
MCQLCRGTRLYLPKGAQEPEDCPWCDAADKDRIERRKAKPAPPRAANDDLDLDAPIPF